MPNIKRSILFIFVLAFLIRILLIVVTSQSLKEHGDVFLHRDWGRVSFLFGPGETYRKDNISNVGAVNNLPPGATYMISSMYYSHIQISKVIFKILQKANL